MTRRIVGALILSLPFLASVNACAQPDERWVGDIDFPTNMVFAPDGRLFFTERETGRVRVVTAAGDLVAEPFLTLPVINASETGLLGIALHPRFTEEPWVYLYRSDPASGMNEIVRVRADGDRAKGEPEVLLQTVPATNEYHNGGDMVFGPDGMLYVAVGEAHEPERAQDLDDLGGKVLRLTPEGEPARGNPFGRDVAAFTIGHRNSFGLCFDPATGDLWETENGPDDGPDEVNRLVAGGNYGWPDVTGDSGGRSDDPVTSFAETVVPTGCAWWRGGLYVGEYASKGVSSIDPVSGDVAEAYSFGRTTDLQVGPDGALYVATADAIWRIEDPDASEPTASPTTTSSATEVDQPSSPPASPAADAGDSGRGWIVAVAAVILAGSLALRLWAGRRAGR
ncbi:MAG: PQQ-dependent sugar dehydrogenase [Actinomycetota bacterium]